jgi:hypothetical protein
MWQTTTLKRNLVPEIWERLESKLGLEKSRWATTLKRSFVGILITGFKLGTSGVWLGIGSYFVPSEVVADLIFNSCLSVHLPWTSIPFLMASLKVFTTLQNLAGGHAHRIPTFDNTFLLLKRIPNYLPRVQAYEHRRSYRYVSLDSQSQQYKSE